MLLLMRPDFDILLLCCFCLSNWGKKAESREKKFRSLLFFLLTIQCRRPLVETRLLYYFSLLLSKDMTSVEAEGF